MDAMQDLLRKIPSVEKVLEQPGIVELGETLPRWTIADSAREVLGLMRESISSGKRTRAPEMKEM